MTPLEFVFLAAKGVALGLLPTAAVILAVWIAVRRGLRHERAWAKWQDGSPDPMDYRHLGDGWERAYYHDLAQYIRRAGNEPNL